MSIFRIQGYKILENLKEFSNFWGLKLFGVYLTKKIKMTILIIYDNITTILLNNLKTLKSVRLTFIQILRVFCIFWGLKLLRVFFTRKINMTILVIYMAILYIFC